MGRYQPTSTMRSTSQDGVRFPPIHTGSRARPFSAGNTSNIGNNNYVEPLNNTTKFRSRKQSSSITSLHSPSPTFLTGLPDSSTPSSCQSSSRRSYQSSSSSRRNRVITSSNINQRKSRPSSSTSIISDDSGDMVNYENLYASESISSESTRSDISSWIESIDVHEEGATSPDRHETSHSLRSSVETQEGTLENQEGKDDAVMSSISQYGSNDYMGAGHFETSKLDFLQNNCSENTLNILYCDNLNSEMVSSLYDNVSCASSSSIVDPSDFVLLDDYDEEGEDVVEFEAVRSSVSQILDDYSQRQDVLRNELEAYLIHMKEKTDEEGERLINFDSYEQRVNQLTSDIMNAPTEVNRLDLLFTSPEVARQLIRATNLSYQEAAKKIMKDEPIDSAVEKIRRLDMILEEKLQIQEKLSEMVVKIVNRDRHEKMERERLKKNVRQQLREKLEKQEAMHDRSSLPLTQGDTNNSTSSQRRTTSSNSIRSQSSGSDSTFSYRNITMGADARYYSLSESEQQRVTDIIQDSSFDGDGNDVVVPPGFGFIPSESQRDRLIEIDKQLNALKPNGVEGFSSDTTSIISDMNTEDFETIQTRNGIDYLRMNRIERAQKQRIREISEKIAELYRGYSEITADKCTFDEATLTTLIEQCKNEERLLLERRIMSETSGQEVLENQEQPFG